MKVSRHAKIIELISQYDIETQEELAEYLNNAGFKVTQATVSRDIRDLKLTKVSLNGGKQKYVIHRQDEDGMSEKYIRVLRDGYMSMDMAQNILVIKTVSGMAMAVAVAVDAMKWNEVVGCIAGDDTIMCAIHNAEEAGYALYDSFCIDRRSEESVNRAGWGLCCDLRCCRRFADDHYGQK